MTFLCITRQLLNQSTLATPPLPPRGRRRGLVCKQQRKSTVASGGAVLHAAWMWTEGWRTEDGGRRWVSGTLERVGDDGETEGQSIASLHIELHFHLRQRPSSHVVDSPRRPLRTRSVFVSFRFFFFHVNNSRETQKPNGQYVHAESGQNIMPP